MARNKSRDDSQGVFLFDSDPLLISSTSKRSDVSRAEAAARRRKTRIGNLERIKGFNGRVGGLFVPHSGTENSAIVYMPINKIRTDTATASERVYEKYDGTDTPTARVDLWAHYASMKSKQETRKKYRSFRDNAATSAARIALHLVDYGGEIDRDAFTFDPEYRMNPDSHKARNDILAYNSVLKYFIDLEAFTGTNPDLFNKSGHRKWAQMRHTKDYTERMDRAHQELQPLADDLFAERVDEAYWNHQSRNMFWVGVNKQLEDIDREKWNTKTPPETLPIEAYENSPDNFV